MEVIHGEGSPDKVQGAGKRSGDGPVRAGHGVSIICYFTNIFLFQQSNYYIRISRFLPCVEVVEKHGTVPKRLFIRGHNGRIYPYLIVSDSSPSEGCREERVLQLLRMLNHFFGKQKVSNHLITI